ncbi:hypothetical protein T4C_1639 [Trichinella pseudospiralis]|uniref:Uncharacterized protein n=1 Tax=Trichinella pseudospiralis TaxID=6337 RepID=A0A0V1JD83_TRIPS|nr:hypothetical protein T4C_1639 [Trichinella pseudospiralis]
MMRNDLRRAAGRSETSLIRIKIIRCCWRDGWLGTGRYKNRPHLFESGAKHWVILATCWRAYGTNVSGRDRYPASLFKGKGHRTGKKFCTVV